MSIDDRELDQRLAQLTREADADQIHEDQTWRAIESRLESRKKAVGRRVFAGSGIAACFLLALVLIYPAADAPVSIGERVVSAEVEAMKRHIDWGQAPDMEYVNGGFAHAWVDNQKAIRELELALTQYPENLMLLDLLTRAHLRHSELLHLASRYDAINYDVAYNWSL